jgi:hypothetical protein
MGPGSGILATFALVRFWLMLRGWGWRGICGLFRDDPNLTLLLRMRILSILAFLTGPIFVACLALSWVVERRTFVLGVVGIPSVVGAFVEVEM